MVYVIVGAIITCIVIVILEVNAITGNQSWLEYLGHVVQTVDFILLVLTQIPPHFESALAFTDCIILSNRICKLVHCFEIELEYCLNKALQMRGKVEINVNDQYYTRGSICALEPNERADFNDKLDRYCQISSLLYFEFKNLKKQHELFLNLLIFLGGLSISLALSLFWKATTYLEFGILSASLLSSGLPIILVVFYCSRVEQAVSIGSKSI